MDDLTRTLLDALPGQAVAAVITGVCERLNELDGAELQVAGGDTVRVVSQAELEEWMRGLAARANAGDRPL